MVMFHEFVQRLTLSTIFQRNKDYECMEKIRIIKIWKLHAQHCIVKPYGKTVNPIEELVKLIDLESTGKDAIVFMGKFGL
jgi:hypothetical protein